MSVQSYKAIPEYQTRSIRSDADAQAAVDFKSSASIRHKVRLSGMNANYWYPAEWSEKIGKGQHGETQFWGHSIALFRGEDGTLAALENRCAHRHLPLTMGRVRNCNLVCAYHGWAYNKEGVLQSVEHDLFGSPLPDVRIRTYPVKERYGLIWIFPGDPELSEQIQVPFFPNAEGEERWESAHWDFSWQAHYSMVIDNLTNLCHLYVHGDLTGFDKTWMVDSSLVGERLELRWNHTLPGVKHVLETLSIYDYPYHIVLSIGQMLFVNLMLPKSESETRVFTIMWMRPPDTPILSPAMKRMLVRKRDLPKTVTNVVEIYRQDGATVIEEMRRLDANFFKPIPEVNTAVKLFDRLNCERWQAWLDYVDGTGREGVGTGQKIMMS